MITVVSPNADSIRILRLPQVCEVTGLCRSMIYQMEANLRFPQRVKIGTRALGWNVPADIRTGAQFGQHGFGCATSEQSLLYGAFRRGAKAARRRPAETPS
jgi:predicted DNA-binding transcriptional regulator AlpA